MKDPIKNFFVSESLAGFILNDLHVDCTFDARLPPESFNLYLLNRDEIKHVESVKALVVSFKNEDNKL